MKDYDVFDPALEPDDEYWDRLYEEKKYEIAWDNMWSSDLVDSGIGDSKCTM